MALPPPNLRDLTLFDKDSNDNESKSRKVWEIGVPAKNSLYWAILISHLLSSNDSIFSNFIDNLKIDASPLRKKKKKTLSDDVKFRTVKSRLYNFNPFKNRHVFFHDSIIIKVFNAFQQRLNQIAADKFKKEEWNDNIKIRAAADWLQCDIDVHFPEESKVISFANHSSKSTHTLIIFEYKDKKYGSRSENINVFRLAMSVEHAKSLKLDALTHILKKTQISWNDISEVKSLMCNTETNEENFLSIILQSKQFNILPKLYKSPYIAVKLSHAGFETNPTVSNSDKPSAFFYASAKAETKYIRILYDYAANCRYLFESTVRDPNDTVLDGLKMLHDVLAKDKSKILTSDCNKGIMELSINIISRFNEFQQNISTAVLKFKKDFKNISTQLKLTRRKEFVCEILEIYLSYFYYEEIKSDNCEIYQNYVNFYDYYEIIDSFSCLCFFDAIYQLKKEFQLKNKNIYAEIESTFLLLIQSNREFPKFNHNIKCCAEYCDRSCQYDKNILLLIPLLHRETLKEKIQNFLSTLSLHDQSPIPPKKIKDYHLRGTLSEYPDIIDEFLIYKIKMYLKAANEVCFENDGMVKCILVIERALQALGESIQHQRTENCVVTFLLGCRLPSKTIGDLICIRNTLSHYHDSSATGRLAVENNSDNFNNLQNELRRIRKNLEIVAFTQRSRLEKYLIENCKMQLIRQKYEEATIQNFIKYSNHRLKGENYPKYYRECIILSLNIINSLIECIDHEENNSNSKHLKTDEIFNSIQYVFSFLCENVSEDFFQPYLNEILSYKEKYKNDNDRDSLLVNISDFLDTYRQKMEQQWKIHYISYSNSQFQTLDSFFNCLKQNDNSTHEIDVVVQEAENAYIEATCAKDELMKLAHDVKCITLSGKEEKLLERLVISTKKLQKLRKYFKENNKRLALKELDIEGISVESIKNTLKQMLKKNSKDEEVENSLPTSSANDDIVKTLLIKMVFQRKLTSPIYTSVKLSEDICEKFEKFLTKKVDFLLSRIENMKSVLIEDDDEIKEAWQWGRSVEMKHHTKYLMRQRFLRELLVRSSLEMAFFDCLNILNNANFAEIFEKVNNLFAGINLRNVLAHGHCVLEVVGGFLDEDDLPTEFINKILELIDDSEAIISMMALISISDTLEAECFQSWIERNDDNEEFKNLIKKVTRCPRWKSYLFLLPLA